VLDVNRRVLEMYRVAHEEATIWTIWDGYSAPDNPLEELSSLWERTVAGEDQLFEENTIYKYEKGGGPYEDQRRSSETTRPERKIFD
jgi:hypothetical protein